MFVSGRLNLDQKSYWNHCRCLRRFEGWKNPSMAHKIPYTCQSDEFLPKGFKLWISIEGNILSANIGRTRVLRFINGVRLSPVPISYIVWWSMNLWSNYGMAFQTKRISAPGLENKTPNIFFMHPMLNVCNPSSCTYELIFQVSGIISTGIHTYCASRPCWIFMQLLRSLQEVNHLPDLPDVWSDHWISLPPVVFGSQHAVKVDVSAV